MSCAPEPVSDATPQDQALGALLRRLLDQVEFLTVFWDGDCYQLDVTLRGGERRRVQHERPADLLMAGLGVEARKQCLGPCARIKPLGDFAGDRNNPDGLLRRCRTCERIRVALYKRRRRRGRVEE